MKPVAVCENDRCEKTIFKGEEAWHKGHELYCSGKCLIESFGSPVEEQVVGGAR
ncbi:hypothetical protein [Bacillus sp. FJAT-22090]|uniref:hypothetical protein n=1 Tax=Bacillus sp. FJAT-22090 TaxID=1581038 RepID=UPI0016436290|nr:hypothetical protein [Bacillus sp. FJAT-22090]